MTTKISEAVLCQLGEFVACHFGLHFPQERWRDLEREVCAAAQECGGEAKLDHFLQGLLSSPGAQRQMEVLARHLTIGETYFFREKRSLEIFEGQLAPELIRARESLGRRIRIWSAGCATGEEPYSIAILLSKLMEGLKEWNLEIVATDINTRSLRKAAEGTYSDWSFRGTPPWVRLTYFEGDGNGRCTIVPAIKKMVRFSQFNLMDEAYPVFPHCGEGFDVIFCRNVLMYFTPEGMGKVVRQLYRSLAPDGWLIVSPTETSQELFCEFATVSFGDVTFYRKSANRAPLPFVLPVPDEGGSSLVLPEWAAETLETTRPSFTQSFPEELREEAGLPDTAPPTVSSDQALYGQALAFYEQGRYEAAQQAIVTLLSYDGNDAQAMLLLARTLANRGELAKALAWCDKAIAADKMAARAHYLRATILQEQGCIPEVLFALKRAVYAEPQFVLGHFSLGNLALQQGRREESAKHFENVLLLLARYKAEEIVPESEGMSAGRLRELVIRPTSQEGGINPAGQPQIRIPQPANNPEVSGREVYAFREDNRRG